MDHIVMGLLDYSLSLIQRLPPSVPKQLLRAGEPAPLTCNHNQ